MLDTLRTNNLLTSRRLGEVVGLRESLDKELFHVFISEIPADFMSFVTDRDKASRVREHLKKVYSKNPKDEEVAIVTRRLVNLANAATHRRDEIENRLLRTQFKNENWKRVGRCQVCGYLFTSADEATVDHILPFSLGGEDDESNWELQCRLCNDQKSHHFGCCDIARVSIITEVSFFTKSLSDQLKLLSKSHLPVRYELLELNSRKCCDCGKRSNAVKLVISIRHSDRMVTVDNLDVHCEKCCNRKNIKKEHQLK